MVHGIRGVAVEMLRYHEEPDRAGIVPGITDVEVSKVRVSNRLDTLVVRTVNDECPPSARYSRRPSESVRHSTWGVRRATVKLKGIDGARTSGGTCGLIR